MTTTTTLTTETFYAFSFTLEIEWCFQATDLRHAYQIAELIDPQVMVLDRHDAELEDITFAR